MSYVNCKWCHGSGCLYCETEREKARNKEIKPIFTADPNDPRDMELLKEAFGIEAINAAWETAKDSYDPAHEFNRLLTLNGLIASLAQHVLKNT